MNKITRRDFIKRLGAWVGIMTVGVLDWRPGTTIQAKDEKPRQRHCRPRCVILEIQGRQNEPPVIYEVCQ